MPRAIRKRVDMRAPWMSRRQTTLKLRPPAGTVRNRPWLLPGRCLCARCPQHPSTAWHCEMSVSVDQFPVPGKRIVRRARSGRADEVIGDAFPSLRVDHNITKGSDANRLGRPIDSVVTIPIRRAGLENSRGGTDFRPTVRVGAGRGDGFWRVAPFAAVLRAFPATAGRSRFRRHRRRGRR